MLPIFLYMSKDECLRNLRQLELEAYSMLVTALRAQGPLNQEKRKLLKDLGKILNISIDRHKCEVRRAANDEKLNTIAYQMNGSGISLEDWCQEGRRVLPMLQRISPQTLHPIITDNFLPCSSNQQTYQTIVNVTDAAEMPSNDLNQELESDATSLQNPLIIKPKLYKHSNPQGSSIEQEKPEKTYSARKIINKNQKFTIVSTTETIPTNSILHKTLSVPISKVTKLNLDKFKIVPSSFSANAKQNFITNKTAKKIIPLSQLQMLNHKLSSKGGIKVLPISSKLLGKNITMTRIIPQQGLKTPILQPFIREIPALSKIKVENIEQTHETAGINQQEEDENKEKGEEMNEDEENSNIEKPSIGEEAQTMPIEKPEEAEPGDLTALMEIDSSEFIEPELKEAIDVKQGV